MTYKIKLYPNPRVSPKMHLLKKARKRAGARAVCTKCGSPLPAHRIADNTKLCIDCER